METIIIKVKYQDMETTQVFIDDIEGASKEYQYWQNLGASVESTQAVQTSEALQ